MNSPTEKSTADAKEPCQCTACAVARAVLGVLKDRYPKADPILLAVAAAVTKDFALTVAELLEVSRVETIAIAELSTSSPTTDGAVKH